MVVFSSSSIFFFLIFPFKARTFWSVCLEIWVWVWVWISNVGFLLDMAKGVCILIWGLFRVSIFRGWVLRTFQNEFTGLCGCVRMSCVHIWMWIWACVNKMYSSTGMYEQKWQKGKSFYVKKCMLVWIKMMCTCSVCTC